MGRSILKANLFMILVEECYGRLIFANLFMILVEECCGKDLT